MLFRSAETPAEPNSALVLTTAPTHGDVEVELRLRIVRPLGASPRSTDAASLYWQYVHNEQGRHGYRFDLGTGGWSLRKVYAGPADKEAQQPPLATGADARAEAGTWHRLRVLQQGARIQAWVDGKRVCDVVDPGTKWGTYTSGSVGLYCTDTYSQFDDVVVRRP